MKLVIPSVGPDLTSQVDPRFGRARFLVQYDSISSSFVATDNSAQAEAVQGAGVQAAQKVLDLGAEALLTGHCGPKAFHVLVEGGVKIYSGFEGTVLGAVKAWQEGELKILAAPDGKARH